MKKFLLSLTLMTTLSAGNLAYAQKHEAPKFVTNIEGTKEYSLSNGMKILLLPDPSQSNFAK